MLVGDCVDENGFEDGRGQFAAAAAVVFEKAAAMGAVVAAVAVVAGLYEDWKTTRWEEVLRAIS